MTAVEHERVEPGARQVRGENQAVVARAENENVVLHG
jgi:hypothetical protein